MGDVTVLFADRQLGVRHRLASVSDGHGDHFGGEWGALAGPWPGRVAGGPDVPVGQIGGRTWTLAVDPQGWPLNQGDLVEDAEAGTQWLVTSAQLIFNTEAPDVDYVRVEAHLRTVSGTSP